jgi:hypothetical protein
MTIGNILFLGHGLWYNNKKRERGIPMDNNLKQCCNICGRELKEDEFFCDGNEVPIPICRFDVSPGFGSVFDMGIFEINFCFDCFDKLVKSCKINPEVCSSWEMSDKEFAEYMNTHKYTRYGIIDLPNEECEQYLKEYDRHMKNRKLPK